jgi:hypothetical protein
MATQHSCRQCGKTFEVAPGQEVRCPACGKAADQATVATAVAQPPPSSPPPVSPSQPAWPPAGPFQEKLQSILGYGKQLSLAWWDHAKRALARNSSDIHVAPAEQDQLARCGISDLAVHKHFAWRRSLLWFIVAPTIFTAIFVTIDTFSGDFEGLSSFGALMTVLYALSLWAIPAATVLGAREWYKPRRSRLFLLSGFLVSYGVIVLWGLTPLAWWFELEDTGDPEAMQMVRQVIGLLGGVFMVFFVMLPAALALLPGAIRACVRIKVLFPQSIVSGWLLITVTPLFAVSLLMLFIMVNQAAGNLLLIAGAVGLVAAPVTYLVQTPLFIRPLWTEEDRGRIAKAQWVYIGIVAGAAALLLIYALTKVITFPGPIDDSGTTQVRLVGGESRLIGFWSFTWHTFKFLIDYMGRSLFITSIAMDWFLLINVSAWQNTRAFEATDAAADYEKTINQMGEVLVRD